MACIVLGVGTGHASTLGTHPSQVRRVAERDIHDPRIDYTALLQQAPARVADEITDEKMQQHYEECLAGVTELGRVFRSVNPDVIIVIGDDQHEQFLDDNLPMFAIFHGQDMPITHRRYAWSDPKLEWASQDHRTSIPGEPALANHLLQHLCAKGFDLARCSKLRPEVGLGHAFVNPYRRYFPDRTIPMVPIMVNTYFPPNQPTPERCYAFGQALREAVESWDADSQVAIVASGGLSHSVIDEDLDRNVLDAMRRKDATLLRSLPVEQLIRGTSEIRNWIIGAAGLEHLNMTVVAYVPYYRSPAGTGCGGGFAYWT